MKHKFVTKELKKKFNSEKYNTKKLNGNASLFSLLIHTFLSSFHFCSIRRIFCQWYISRYSESETNSAKNMLHFFNTLRSYSLSFLIITFYGDIKGRSRETFYKHTHTWIKWELGMTLRKTEGFALALL